MRNGTVRTTVDIEITGSFVGGEPDIGTSDTTENHDVEEIYVVRTIWVKNPLYLDGSEQPKQPKMIQTEKRFPIMKNLGPENKALLAQAVLEALDPTDIDDALLSVQ